MAEWAKLIEAIAGLVGAIAWPVAIVLAVWLIMQRHKAAFGRLIDRVTAVSYPGGQIDLAEIEAAKLAEEEADQEAQVAELVEQAAGEEEGQEQRREVLEALAAQAEELGRVRSELGLLRSQQDTWLPTKQPPPSGFPKVPDYVALLSRVPEEVARLDVNRAEARAERRRQETVRAKKRQDEADLVAAETAKRARSVRQSSEG
ncbi:hypothetical protein ACLQ2R_05100 [Streptosporangium sp. DT93]|uniref:hypothetical protein n=1 Tax=Streptosporangium sp. DT93 TaxID=3393428 RepID=UPI003CF4EC0A